MLHRLRVEWIELVLLKKRLAWLDLTFLSGRNTIIIGIKYKIYYQHCSFPIEIELLLKVPFVLSLNDGFWLLFTLSGVCDVESGYKVRLIISNIIMNLFQWYSPAIASSTLFILSIVESKSRLDSIDFDSQSLEFICILQIWNEAHTDHEVGIILHTLSPSHSAIDTLHRKWVSIDCWLRYNRECVYCVWNWESNRSIFEPQPTDRT